MFFFNDDLSNRNFSGIRNKLRNLEQISNIILMVFACLLAIVYIICEALHGRFTLSSVLLLLLFIGLLVLFIRKKFKARKTEKYANDELDDELDGELAEDAIFDFSNNETDLEVENHED